MRIRMQLFSAGLAALIVAAGGGCKPAGGPDRAQAPAEGGTALTGAVRIDGSSTVFPITEAVAEEFRGRHPEVNVTVGVSGTGGGFKKFVRNEIDIAGASRPIKESEIEAAREQGIEFVELPVAYDAIAVVVNPKNTWAQEITVEELKKLWAPEAQGKITRWNQIRSSWPDRPIKLYGPGADSGTFDYFTDAIVGEEGASRGDYTASEDDNILVQGVANDENALGYFGLAYYLENKEKLKPLPVDDGDPANGEGPQEPTAENVLEGTYQPLSRPVFIYIRREAADQPAVQAFVKFYLDNAPELAREVGYVPLQENVYDLARTRFENRTTGTLFTEGTSQVGADLAQLMQDGPKTE